MLASAGVVDAGAQAYVLLLDALVEVLGGAPARPLTAATRSAPGLDSRRRGSRRVRGDLNMR